MHVRFLGCGDAFGSGGRLNTCFLVNRGDASFLIDCGASAMISIRRFGIDPNSVGAIVLFTCTSITLAVCHLSFSMRS